MRAHVKKGYTHSGIVDIRIVRQRKPVFRAGVARHLERAAEYRSMLLNAELSCIGTIVEYRDGIRYITDISPELAKHLARDYISRAREWRNEFGA